MKLRSLWPAVASTIKSIPGRGKAIFWTGSIYIGEVNVASPFAIFLFDEDYISQPVRVFYFSDSFSLEEFVNFFIDHILPF